MLGLTATVMLAQFGAEVVVFDTDVRRRERAWLFGAAEVTAEPVSGADLALELSGNAAVVQLALDSVAVGGTVVLAGSVSPGPSVRLDPQRLVRSLITITGVHNYRPADLRTAVDFLAAHHSRYPFGDLVAGVWSLDRLGDAFAAARSGVGVRQAVRPGG